MDKTTVIEDIIKYVKQLQEHVKSLEKNLNKKKSKESVILIKNPQISADDDTSSCDENLDRQFKEPLPEIEARISDKNVLIRIHWEKRKGFAVKLLTEIEKNHLSVVNTSFLPFGDFAMDITVVAQMEAEFCSTVKDLVSCEESAVGFFELISSHDGLVVRPVQAKKLTTRLPVVQS